MFQGDLEFRLRYYLQLKMKEKKVKGRRIMERRPGKAQLCVVTHI